MMEKLTFGSAKQWNYFLGNKQYYVEDNDGKLYEVGRGEPIVDLNYAQFEIFIINNEIKIVRPSSDSDRGSLTTIKQDGEIIAETRKFIEYFPIYDSIDSEKEFKKLYYLEDKTSGLHWNGVLIWNTPFDIYGAKFLYISDSLFNGDNFNHSFAPNEVLFIICTAPGPGYGSNFYIVKTNSNGEIEHEKIDFKIDGVNVERFVPGSLIVKDTYAYCLGYTLNHSSSDSNIIIFDLSGLINNQSTSLEIYTSYKVTTFDNKDLSSGSLFYDGQEFIYTNSSINQHSLNFTPLDYKYKINFSGANGERINNLGYFTERITKIAGISYFDSESSAYTTCIAVKHEHDDYGIWDANITTSKDIIYKITSPSPTSINAFYINGKTYRITEGQTAIRSYNVDITTDIEINFLEQESDPSAANIYIRQFEGKIVPETGYECTSYLPLGNDIYILQKNKTGVRLLKNSSNFWSITFSSSENISGVSFLFTDGTYLYLSFFVSGSENRLILVSFNSTDQMEYKELGDSSTFNIYPCATNQGCAISTQKEVYICANGSFSLILNYENYVYSIPNQTIGSQRVVYLNDDYLYLNCITKEDAYNINIKFNINDKTYTILNNYENQTFEDKLVLTSRSACLLSTQNNRIVYNTYLTNSFLFHNIIDDTEEEVSLSLEKAGTPLGASPTRMYLGLDAGNNQYSIYECSTTPFPSFSLNLIDENNDFTLYEVDPNTGTVGVENSDVFKNITVNKITLAAAMKYGDYYLFGFMPSNPLSVSELYYGAIKYNNSNVKISGITINGQNYPYEEPDGIMIGNISISNTTDIYIHTSSLKPVAIINSNGEKTYARIWSD